MIQHNEAWENGKLVHEEWVEVPDEAPDPLATVQAQFDALLLGLAKSTSPTIKQAVADAQAATPGVLR